MDLKEYGKQDISEFIDYAQKDSLNPKDKEKLEEISGKYGEQVDDLIGRFQGMSEPDLMREIFGIINQKKRDGTFNPTEIRKLADTIRPMLNNEQQQKLDVLLGMLL